MYVYIYVYVCFYASIISFDVMDGICLFLNLLLSHQWQSIVVINGDIDPGDIDPLKVILL